MDKGRGTKNARTGQVRQGDEVGQGDGANVPIPLRRQDHEVLEV
jgi:hypothetical protein